MGEEPLSDNDDIEFLGPNDVSLDETVVYRDATDSLSNDTEQFAAEISCLAEYRLDSLIGRGGMGLVYRAEDLILKREVAIKVLRKEFLNNQHIVQRFLNESLIKSGLQHPGVAPVYGAGLFADGRPFYAMKLIEGKTLGHLISTSEGSGNIGLLNVLAQTCQTIAYAHAVGILHLDLKPNNIMVGDYGDVLVIDWGLARRIDGSEPAEVDQTEASRSNAATLEAEESGWIHGTPAYMAPEQARGGFVDTRTDVFSLGAILCEILTGFPAYQGSSSKQLLRRAIRGETSQAMLNLEQSENELWLVGLVRRCLARDPQERPADASELAKMLSDFQESMLNVVESDMSRFFELSADLFCIAGFDGCFRRVNSNFPRATKRTEQELLSQPFINFVHPEDKQQTLAELGRTMQGHPVERFRNRYITGDGSVLHLEWTAKSVISEGLIFAVARDVSPRE